MKYSLILFSLFFIGCFSKKDLIEKKELYQAMLDCVASDIRSSVEFHDMESVEAILKSERSNRKFVKFELLKDGSRMIEVVMKKSISEGKNVKIELFKNWNHSWVLIGYY